VSAAHLSFTHSVFGGAVLLDGCTGGFLAGGGTSVMLSRAGTGPSRWVSMLLTAILHKVFA
jgi:hypothetical protein